MIYQGISSVALANNWLSTYDGRWGSSFLGAYVMDEPGGKMLEGRTYLPNPDGPGTFIKTEDGTIEGYFYNETGFTFARNGTANVMLDNLKPPYLTSIIYYRNGTVTAQKNYTSPQEVISDPSILPYTYDKTWQMCPIQNTNDAARLFVAGANTSISNIKSNSKWKLQTFTSDFALQWFDYQGGYDCVFTEFCWNESTTQAIAAVRGAANLYEKDWGAMITWKYTEAPYLESGDEMYEQLCTAYENGAKYIAIFNYAPGMQGAYGTLQEEHFDALQRFWTDEVNNPNVTRGQIKAGSVCAAPELRFRLT